MRFQEPLHALFAHPDASREQLLPYPWPAVFAFDFGVNRTDVCQQWLAADSHAAGLALSGAPLCAFDARRTHWQ